MTSQFTYVHVRHCVYFNFDVFSTELHVAGYEIYGDYVSEKRTTGNVTSEIINGTTGMQFTDEKYPQKQKFHNHRVGLSIFQQCHFCTIRS